MRVYRSRFTPGLANAVDVQLVNGERIAYRLLDGNVVGAVVASELSRHTNGALGYECTFDDDGKLGFADWSRIVDWRGKTA